MKVSVFLFLSLTVLCYGQPLSKRSKMRLCGSHLVNALTLVCNGEFYGPSVELIKRDGDQDAADIYSSWLLGDQSSRADVVDNKPRFRRNFEGIVDECCRKSCSYAVLSSYCMK